MRLMRRQQQNIMIQQLLKYQEIDADLKKFNLPYNNISNLIEENRTGSFKQDWISTHTQDIKPV